MKKTAIGLAFLLAFTVSNTTLVQAKETGPLQINMKSYAISSNAEGKEVATETTEVDPKQVLEFRAIYKLMLRISRSVQLYSKDEPEPPRPLH